MSLGNHCEIGAYYQVAYSAKKKSTWPRQSAVIISDSNNTHMVLREILRGQGWNVTDTTASVKQATEKVRSGQAFLIIVDDSASMPAIQKLRVLLTDPITVLTPTMCFFQFEKKREAPAIARMGRPQLVEKPLTPAKFLPGFQKIVRLWQNQPLLTLRRANYQVMNKNIGVGLRAMEKLNEVDPIRPMVSQALALHLRSIGKLKNAENLLLATLKKNPRDLGTMIALGDLYLHAAMPHLAIRLFLGAYNAYGQSLSVITDLIQSSLFIGRSSEAIDYLFQMHNEEFMPDQAATFLARMLLSEGRVSEAESILFNNRDSYHRLAKSWLKAEESQPAQVHIPQAAS